MFIVQFRGFAAPDLGMTSLRVDAERVDIVYSETPDGPESVLTVATSNGSIDIAASDGSVPAQVSLLLVPPGFVHQIGFVTRGITALVDGESVEVKLPSGSETGLEIIPCDETQPFPAKADSVTTVDVPVDVEHQIHANHGQGLMIKPVVCGTTVAQGDCPADEAPLPPWVDDQVFVMFEPGTSDEYARSVATAFSATVARKASALPWYTLQLPPGSDERAVSMTLRGVAGVAVSHLNYNAQFLNLMPEDFSAPGDTSQYWLFQTQTPQAWEATVGDSRVILAVHDGGVNVFHEELQENIFINVGEIPDAVTRAFNCSVLPTPFDLSSLDLDADGDGATTLRDFNLEPNRTLLLDAMAQTDRTPKSTTGDVRLEDFITESPDTCGLFENHGSWEERSVGDGDGNSFPDDIIGWDFIDDDNFPVEWPYPDCKTLEHGGAVAGIAGASEDGESIFNDADVRRAPAYVGQAWRMRLLPIRALRPGTAMSRDIRIESVRYAVDMGAHIINMSWSEICAPPKDQIEPDVWCDAWDYVERPITRLQDFGNAGVTAPSAPLLVVGGINRSVDLGLPLALDLPTELELPNLISVTSVTATDQHGSASTDISWGASVYDIAAPGVAMPVLSSSGIVLDTDPGGSLLACEGLYLDPETNDVKLVGGNSLAAPQVSGVAALVIAKELADGQPWPSAEAVRARILNNADVVPTLSFFVEGGRRLNACKAVYDGPCPNP